MLTDLKEIKEIRKKFGLTQTQLARLANVSQSLVAKIESGLIDPTYSNAISIFNALESLSRKKDLKAEAIMAKKIISVGENERIKAAIKKMKKYDISQMPVIDGNKVHGLVSDSILLEALLNKGANIKIKEVMTENPPTVSKNANVQLVSSLLKFYPMVIVAEKERFLA